MSPGTMEFSVKYFNGQLFVNGISRNAHCIEVLSHLELRLGKIPGNAKLKYNGRYLKIHKSFEEVCQG